MADDDLRGDLMAAFANPSSTPAASETAPLPGADAPPSPSPAPTPEATPAAPEAAPGAPADQPRNPDGTFAAKPAEAAPAAPAAPPAGKETPPPATPAATPPADRIAAPENWKGAGKLKWEKLPRDIQQEIVAEFGRIGQIESQLSAYRQAIGPRAARLAAEYGSVERAIEQLFALSDFAAADANGFLNWFAQTRGITSPGAAPQPQQPGQPAQPAADPALMAALKPYLDKIGALEKRLSDSDASTQQEAYTATLQTVEQFVADPAHPYAAEVAAEMTRLIEGGVVPRGPNALQQAYQSATWSNPTIRAQLIEQQREKERAEAQSRVDAARKAGASLNGSPLPGAVPATVDPERDLRSEIMAQWNRSGGRI